MEWRRKRGINEGGTRAWARRLESGIRVLILSRCDASPDMTCGSMPLEEGLGCRVTSGFGVRRLRIGLWCGIGGCQIRGRLNDGLGMRSCFR